MHVTLFILFYIYTKCLVDSSSYFIDKINSVVRSFSFSFTISPKATL